MCSAKISSRQKTVNNIFMLHKQKEAALKKINLFSFTLFFAVYSVFTRLLKIQDCLR